MNQQQEPKVYIDKGWKGMKPTFLPDEVYTQALSSFVLVCVDVVIIDRAEKKIYLAKRKAKPGSGWWWIGGRLKAGELPRDAAKRAFERETGITIDTEKLQFLFFCRNFFPDRQQEPQGAGTDGLVHLYALELGEATRKQAAERLDPNEYDKIEGLQGFDRAKLEKEEVRAQVFDAYDALFGGDS